MAQRFSAQYKEAIENSRLPLPGQADQKWHIIDVRDVLCDMTDIVGQLVDTVFDVGIVGKCHKFGLQKIFYIVITAGLLVTHDAEFEDKVCEWSAGHLKEYLIAAGKTEQELEGTSMKFLRGTFTLAMATVSMSSVELGRVDPVMEPPELAVVEDLHFGFVDWLKQVFEKCEMLQMHWNHAPRDQDT